MNKILSDNKKQIETIIREEECAQILVERLDNLLSSSKDKERLEYRGRLFKKKPKITASTRFKEYLKILFIDGGAYMSPGRHLAISANILWHKINAKSDGVPNEDLKKIEIFEKNNLRISASLLRLFATQEAQTLKEYAKIKLPKIVGNHWNSYVRFALWYSYKYGLAETLKEFTNLLIEQGVHPENVFQEINEALSLSKGKAGNRYIRSFHDRKVSDSEENQGETVSLKSIRSAFNSPFPPYVLISTSVGQEGLDFHRYCKSVIHWSPVSSPCVLRQREGRVDRYKALQIRIALSELSKKEHKFAKSHDGLSPDFLVMINGKRKNKVAREVWYLPFTTQAASWLRCLERMYYNDLLIGAPDPLADERFLLMALEHLSPKEQKLRLETLKKYAVSLKPKPINKNILRKLNDTD